MPWRREVLALTPTLTRSPGAKAGSVAYGSVRSVFEDQLSDDPSVFSGSGADLISASTFFFYSTGSDSPFLKLEMP